MKNSWISLFEMEQLASEEEVMAELKELREHGGLELHEFIGELEQAQHEHDRNGK